MFAHGVACGLRASFGLAKNESFRTCLNKQADLVQFQYLSDSFSSKNEFLTTKGDVKNNIRRGRIDA